MNTSDFILTDFSEELFINAFKQMLIKEYGITGIENYELLQKKFESIDDSFALVKKGDNNEIEGLVMAKVIKLSKNDFEAVYGYINTLWISNNCLRLDYGSQLLELCEEQFKKRKITQFIADSDISNVELFRNNNSTRNKCIMHNGQAVLCKM